MSVTTSGTDSAQIHVRKNRYGGSTQVADGQGQPAKKRSAWKTLNKLWALLPPFALGALLLLAWYAATATGRINAFVLPAPAAVFASLVDGLTTGLYWEHILITVQESLLGFLLGVVVALPLGYGVAKSRLLANMLQPYLSAGQAIPAIVLAPFLFLWFNMGLLPVMIVCMLVVLFPMVINTVFGVQTIERELLDAARLEGAAGLSLLTHIEFPLALPSVLAAIRTGLTLSITGALVGEFFCSPDKGLGALILIALHQYNMPFMFATVIILAVLAALYYSATWLLVRLAEAVY
ncbi:riboflavin transport system permease protein RibX [Dictyobacter vulcani]|uniref:Riboflavin transport system permease protein RibX n=1 Tax=Dictyobacter vulcani TaxID=2607529 RepID=A0A5J4KGR4_9CHLR|nr:ABC transporter permease [Dictyobacter vulcani]GER85922.1 riboflavin transport system permease protein RibX [Dictyobacter vulcani]